MADRRTEALKLAKKLVSLLRKKGITVKSAYLFGSIVRDEAAVTSDIDMAIVSPHFSGIRFDDIRSIAAWINKTDSRLEVHTFSLDDEADSFFLRQIVDTGIKIA